MGCLYNVGNRKLSEEQLKDYQKSLLIDSKFSPVQLSDVLRKDYYDVLEDNEQEAINKLAPKDITTVVVFDDVKLFHYADEVSPHFSRMNGTLEDAKLGMLKDKEVVDSYNNEFTESELQTKLKSFLNTLGITSEKIESFEEHLDANGKEFTVGGFADLTNKIVKYDEASLPEEAAHVAVAFGVEPSSTVLEQVVNTDMYKEHASKYMKIYKNETKVRKEVLGKLLAQKIIFKNNEGIDGRLGTRLQRIWNTFKAWLKGNKELTDYLDDLSSKVLSGNVEGFDINKEEGIFYKIEESEYTGSTILHNFKKELEEVIKIKTARLKIYTARAVKSFGKSEAKSIAKLTRDLNNGKITHGIIEFLNQTETEAINITKKLQSLVGNFDKRTLKEKAILLNNIYGFLAAYQPLLKDIRADIDIFAIEPKYASIKTTLTDIITMVENVETQYRKLSTGIFAEVLMPFAEKNPAIKTVSDLIAKIEQGKDISGYRRWFNSMADASDDVLATVDQLVKRHKENARLQAEDIIKDILQADAELKKAGIKDTEWMFEEDSGNIVDKYKNSEYDNAINAVRKELSIKYALPENKFKRRAFLSIFNDFKVKTWLSDNPILDPFVAEIRKKNRGLSDEDFRELVWSTVKKNIDRTWAAFHSEHSAPIEEMKPVIEEKVKSFYESQVPEADRRTDEFVTHVYKSLVDKTRSRMSLTLDETRAKELFEEWLDDRRRYSTFTNNYYYVYELSRPSDKYLNPQYTKIKSNPVLDKYYSLIVKLKEEHDRFLPEKFVNKHLAPQLRKDWLERVKSGGVAQLKEELKDTVKIRESDTEYGQLTIDDKGNVVRYVLTDEKGNPANFLPVYFTTPIPDIKDMSKDATSIMSSYIAMAQQYNEMNKIVDVLELGNELMARRKIEVGENLLSRANELFTGTKVISQQTGGQAYQRYKDYLEMNVFGKQKAAESSQIFEYLGIDQGKAFDAFNKYTGIQGLALNIYSGINNVLLGNLLSRQEAFAGQFATHTDFLQADKIYWSNLHSVIADIGNNLTNSKLRLFGEAIDVFQDFSQRIVELETDRSRAGRLFNISALFAMQKAGEHAIQYRVALAMANNTKLNLNGKEITLWDALEVNNYRISIKSGVKKLDGTDFTKDDLIEFGLRVRGLNNSLQGIYSAIDRSAIQKYGVGRMLLIFRKFIVPGFNRRFEGKRFNYDTNTEVEGYYRTTAKFFGMLASELKAGKLSYIANWNKLSPMEKANIIRTYVDIAYGFAVLTLMAILTNLADDDDDNWVLNMAAVQASRVYADLRFYTSPSEFLRLTKSPAAGVMQMETLSHFFDILDPYGAIFQEDPFIKEVKSGKNKGETYFWVTLKKATPVWSQVEKWATPEERLIFYSR